MIDHLNAIHFLAQVLEAVAQLLLDDPERAAFEVWICDLACSLIEEVASQWSDHP